MRYIRKIKYRYALSELSHDKGALQIAGLGRCAQSHVDVYLNTFTAPSPAKVYSTRPQVHLETTIYYALPVQCSVTYKLAWRLSHSVA